MNRPAHTSLRKAAPADGALDDYRRIFMASPVPALLADVVDLRIRGANPAASRHYGYAHGELVGRPLFDLLDEGEAPPQQVQGAPGWIAVRSQWRLRHRNFDASLVHVGPVVQFGGRPAYYLWSAPILPEKPVGERAGSATGFAFAAFHDLKEPLHLVKGYLDLLRPRVEADHDALDFLDTARASTERMQALVHGLLEYFRLQTNATRPEPVDLAESLREAEETLRLSVEVEGARVEHGPLPTVMADRMQMARLLQNLVGNAIKFHGGAPPVVRVSAERAAGGWTFTVADNGIGIPSDERESVFKPFHRLQSIDRYPGTGLGLSTCRLIVEAHGGRIWAEGAPGGGAAVRFTLPDGGASREA